MVASVLIRGVPINWLQSVLADYLPKPVIICWHESLSLTHRNTRFSNNNIIFFLFLCNYSICSGNKLQLKAAIFKVYFIHNLRAKTHSFQSLIYCRVNANKHEHFNLSECRRERGSEYVRSVPLSRRSMGTLVCKTSSNEEMLTGHTSWRQAQELSSNKSNTPKQTSSIFDFRWIVVGVTTLRIGEKPLIGMGR